MRILAIEPFYGGSHRAFLDGWKQHSQHEFTVLGLPAYKWKWRMRHAAVTFASILNQPQYVEHEWDVLWCSDMLNLSEFLGLVRPGIQRLPRIVYFHENQLTYPVREEKRRDLHFAYSNFTTAIAANQIWFNSEFHRDEFLTALRKYLARMPDYRSLEEIPAIEAKSSVQHPGIEPFPPRNSLTRTRESGPLIICWNARWEHDKNPEDFFEALRILRQQGVAFRLIVLGEVFKNSLAVFDSAMQEFVAETLHWGYAESRSDYRRLIGMADVVVSTANHEFFGIGIVEGVAAGVFPVVPRRLAYPEILTKLGFPTDAPNQLHQYDGSVEQLVDRLSSLSTKLGDMSPTPNKASIFNWEVRASELDSKLRLACRS